MRARINPRVAMRALVLSGGAARGAYEAGVVCALGEREKFDIVCGSSIGALNGHLVAQERLDLLQALWRDVTPLRLLQVSPGELVRFRGVFSHGPVQRLVERYADLSSLKLTYIAAVTNLTLGTAESFFAFPASAKNAEAAFREAEPNARPLSPTNLVAAICASASVPPAFSPVAITVEDGRRHVYGDACIANNSPVRQAIDAGPTISPSSSCSIPSCDGARCASATSSTSRSRRKTSSHSASSIWI